MAPCWHGWQKIRKRLYLSPWAKTATTTLKVWENKVPSVFSILAQRLRYRPFLNLVIAPCWLDWQKIRKRLYLSPWAKIFKIKGTLFPSTFKVGENKVPLVFLILVQRLRYSHFLNSRMAPCWHGWQKMRKRLYLSSWSKIEKNKSTSLSQIFKAEGNYMPLVLSNIVQGLRYSLVLIFCHPCQQGANFEIRKWLYLSLWVKIYKN